MTKEQIEAELKRRISVTPQMVYVTQSKIVEVLDRVWPANDVIADVMRATFGEAQRVITDAEGVDLNEQIDRCSRSISWEEAIREAGVCQKFCVRGCGSLRAQPADNERTREIDEAYLD